jgi:hypothetical protein
LSLSKRSTTGRPGGGRRGACQDDRPSVGDDLDGVLYDKISPPNVDIELFVEKFLVNVIERRKMRHARVDEQNVDAAVFYPDPIDQRLR